ncbi:MAG TPA: PIN domain-containing protein [Pyrinomonadaceae bacterium]|jgi:predicted nucleic acid-binding protein|nr:PIN domain-containing protein [Pyrinomonadaceae bacterium]
MNRHRVYIDTCCLIDALQHREGMALSPDKQNDVWHIQQILRAGLAGDLEVITSTLTIAEFRRVKSDVPPSKELKRLIRSILLSGRVITLAQMTQGIAERARDLDWVDEISLKGADAIHVATALVTGCKEFYTADGRGPLKPAVITKLSKFRLRSVRPSDARLLPNEYRQGKLTEQESAEQDAPDPFQS